MTERPRAARPTAHRTLHAVLATWAVLALAGAAMRAAAPEAKALSPGPKAASPKPAAEIEALARRDPLEVLRASLRWYSQSVTDYTCTFYKQERIDDDLRKAETTAMKFREQPFSVYLKWTGSVSKDQEVLFVKGKYGDKAVAHPSGLLGLIFRKVSLDPEGKTAMRHSRRPISYAGMANMIRLVIGQCEIAKAAGDLRIEYLGVRQEARRDAYVFNRILPDGKGYPCHQLFIFIDREHLLPVRTEAYLWDGRLLSNYRYTDIVLNPGLTDTDFDADNPAYAYRVF